ncbi:MAG: hypothetical protein C7B47_16880 [Sulfobacillus thermosulfidooxidans]|uniref:Uncharacterized protein n=1 Tax=Sulfobacillus thermosulfidooxidans TaxID=28034 RepID=A0A2T2WIQ4_SULTH|nr:MAG: hypothetical protein C7B47_16880 [Sulfobacillus thermosulfidooxidans]
MTEPVQFAIDGVSLVRNAAMPTLQFLIHIRTTPPFERVHAMVLHVQVQIAPRGRSYSEFVQNRLLDVFGSPQRWHETMHNFLWAQTSLSVPRFEHETTTQLPIVCTYDFDVLAVKYLQSLDAGMIPMEFLFSGTLFYHDAQRGVQVQPISWNCEAPFQLPVNIWRQLMAAYYPHQAWIRIDQDLFDRLNLFRSQHEVSTWDDALRLLLDQGTERRS